MLDAGEPALFVSPHFDDVVLSCGGLVARCAAARVVTVFAGETTEEVVSDFARWKHERWKQETIDHVIATRRDEESAAAAVLGYESLQLGFPDAIYRGTRYEQDSALYAAPISEEFGLIDLIAAELDVLLAGDRRSSAFVPLAAGNHVDHQLVFEAGARLASRGYTVYAYEDSPYAIHSPDLLAERVRSLGDRIGDANVVRVGEAIERRLDGIATYASQVPVLFRFTDDWRGAVRRYAEALGGGEPAERYWLIRK